MIVSKRVTRASAPHFCRLSASFAPGAALGALAACLGLTGSPALAQTAASAQSAAAAPAEGQLEEVTVTARFRAEKLQENSAGSGRVMRHCRGYARRGKSSVSFKRSFD